MSAMRSGSAVSSSVCSASRSVSAARMVSSRLTGVAGCSCVHAGDARALRQADVAAVGRELAQDQLEQRRFADAIAPDQADLGAGRHGDAGVVEEAPSPGVENKVVDLQHEMAEVYGRGV